MFGQAKLGPYVLIGETDARPVMRKTEANAEKVFLNVGKFCKFCYVLVMCGCVYARACVLVCACVCMHGCERESVSQTDRRTDKDGDRKRASVFSHAQMHDSFLIFFSTLLLQTASLMVSIAFLGKTETVDCMKRRER